MASTTRITLNSFNLEEALGGATIAFAKFSNGSPTNEVESYVNNFHRANDSTYVGKVGNIEYKFNAQGGCFDGALTHQLYMVEATIAESEGTKIPSRGDADEEISVDINTLQPREHFAIAALRGIMFHIENPLNLTSAQITQMCTKSFEIANGMMAAAADARAKAEEGGGGSTEEDKKEEVEVNPEELTSNSEKILYNLYIQNYNKAIDEKARFDKLTGATYEDKKLSSVKGLKLHTDTNNPLITKLHADSEIKKIAEVAKVTEVTKVAELTKITNTVDVEVQGTVDANLASSDITVPVSGEVEVTNTVDVTGSVSCSNMLSEPVYVSVRNSPTVTVDNMPSEPIAVTGSVSVSGTVSVDNFPDSGGSGGSDNDQNG